MKRLTLAAIAALLTFAVAPRHLCETDLEGFYEGDRETQLELARSVAMWINAGVDDENFSTGHPLFDSEWTFGTHVMAVLGLVQVIESHPETRAELEPVVHRALTGLMNPKTRAFGTQKFGSDGCSSRAPFGHEHAYLGYLNLALSRARLVLGETAFDDVNDRLSARFYRQLRGSKSGVLETYPGEAYPVDTAAVLASVDVHSIVTGIARDGLSRTRALFEPPRLLPQSVDRKSGAPIDAPRASGTALAAYFLQVSGNDDAQILYRALHKQRGDFLGFSGIREYPRGKAGRGDIDSGLVINGIAVSATGFSLASARAAGDEETFTQLYRTMRLFGLPNQNSERLRFATGGPLGDAILLAILTAPRR